VADFVRPGGVLVYGTCTIEPEENDDIAGWFTDLRSDFERSSVQGLLHDRLVTEDGVMRSLPHVHGIDGAFSARWVRA
jgi:16S rRNA (cytosine967-C5)-methyltransferase